MKPKTVTKSRVCEVCDSSDTEKDVKMRDGLSISIKSGLHVDLLFNQDNLDICYDCFNTLRDKLDVLVDGYLKGKGIEEKSLESREKELLELKARLDKPVFKSILPEQHPLYQPDNVTPLNHIK